MDLNDVRRAVCEILQEATANMNDDDTFFYWYVSGAVDVLRRVEKRLSEKCKAEPMVQMPDMDPREPAGKYL